MNASEKSSETATSIPNILIMIFDFPFINKGFGQSDQYGVPRPDNSKALFNNINGSNLKTISIYHTNGVPT